MRDIPSQIREAIGNCVRGLDGVHKELATAALIESWSAGLPTISKDPATRFEYHASWKEHTRQPWNSMTRMEIMEAEAVMHRPPPQKMWMGTVLVVAACHRVVIPDFNTQPQPA